MTKKTDALILRYGLSVLWQNKYIKTKAVSNIIQLENIIYKELFNKNLKILTIKYRPGFVTVFIYNFCQFFNSLFYQQVIKYYRSVLNLRKVIQKFGENEGLKNPPLFFKTNDSQEAFVLSNAFESLYINKDNILDVDQEFNISEIKQVVYDYED